MMGSMCSESQNPVYNIVDLFFHYYLNERDIEKTLSMLSDSVYTIGTGDGEIAVGKDEFRKLLEAEIKSLPSHIKYTIKDYHEKSKCNGSWYCLCRVEIAIQMPDGSNITYATRFTCSICNENGKMLIQTAHMSESSGHQEEGEFFPIKFASEKMKKIDKEVENELLENFYQMMPGGIIGRYVGDGFPLYVINDQMLNMSGYDNYDDFSDDISGLVINSIHEDDRKKVITVISQGLKKGNQYQVEYRMKTKNKGYIWVYETGRKTIAQDGRDAIIGMVVDISEQVQTRENLMVENSRDSLTGIYNRKGAEKRIADALSLQSSPYLFMMVDLDNFKKLNDIYGHAEGDKALCFIADMLSASFRKTDTVCRIGGDEFAVFIHNCASISAIERKVKRIMREYIQMIKENYPESNSSVSFGGICTKGLNTFTELYKKADSVLYEVKKTQKGKFQIKIM